MADDFGVYDITGRVEAVVSSSILTALDAPSGSINLRRQGERLARDLAELAVATGSFSGRRNPFVLSELSSSHHEVTSANAYLSGTFALETSAVPASGAAYYSKSSRFRRILYSVTASVDLPIIPGNERSPSTIENTSRGTFHTVSGSYRNNSYWHPATFDINIPERGKIRDVKVWLEFIHDHRGGTGTGSADASNIFWNGGTGTASTDIYHGLQGLQISLRSPNVNFRCAHPLWNDNTIRFDKNPNDIVDVRYKKVPELLTNSYLLWAGHSVEKDLGMTLANTTSSIPAEYYLETVVTGVFTNQITYPSMVIDNRDTPMICWNQPHEGKLKIRRSYVTPGVVNYAKETVTTTSNVSSTKLALNNDMYTPNILFGESGGTQLKITRSSSAGWTTQTVTSVTTGDDLYSSFAIDSNDKIFVISPGNNYTAGLFEYDSLSSAWIKYEVAKKSSVYGRSTTITCDEDDVFHFSFFDIENDQQVLKYGKTGSFGLSIETLDTVPLQSYQWMVTIAANTSNEPAIVLSSRELQGFKVYTSSSDGWSSASYSEDILTTGYAANVQPNTAVFDSENNLYVVFDYLRYRGGVTNLFDIGLFTLSNRGFHTIEVVRDRSVTVSGLHASIDVDSHDIVYLTHNESMTSTWGDIILLSKSFGSSTGGAYHEYDTDIDMRTIFCDSSMIKNPRYLYDTDGLQVEKLLDSTWYPSPTSSSLSLFNYQFLDPQFYQETWLTCSNFPWMLDPRIPPGNFQGRNFSATASLNIQIPAGWLTGPGGTAADGEFPTTGSQIGPATIKPVYPLLDDIFVEKSTYQQSLTSVVTPNGVNNLRIVGYRPGLRGTEVNGTWKLMIGNTADYASGDMSGTIRGGIWFRQARLEFLIDEHEESFVSTPSRAFMYNKPTHAISTSGRKNLYNISGSSWWDIGKNTVFVSVNESYGRVSRITADDDSTSFAVFSSLTGSFVEKLSGSNLLDSVNSTFLNNEFGTPYIPISSGSGELPSLDAFSIDEIKAAREVFNTTLNQTTLVPKDNTLKAHVSRAHVLKTTRDAIVESILDEI